MKTENRNNSKLAINSGGLTFPNPFMLSSAPPTTTGEMIKRAFDAGWGGAVSKSLNPEGTVITDVTPRLSAFREPSGKLIGLGNIELSTKRTVEEWLQDFDEIKSEYPDRILVGSMMADPNQKTVQKLAGEIQEHVDAIEVNLSCTHGMPEKNMGAFIGQNPDLTEQIVSWVKEVSDVPVWVKLTFNVADFAAMVQAAKRGGADTIVAINTVSSLIGVDLNTLRPLPTVDGYSSYCGLSGPAIKPLGLKCVAEAAKSADLPISGCGGISTWEDAAEYLAVGASTLQICTAVMFRGYGIIKQLKQGLSKYLDEKGFAGVSDLVGAAVPYLGAHEALNRNSKKTFKIIEELCDGCGRCVKSCRDAGYSAVIAGDPKPHIASEKCDGCSLCQQVCHRRGAVIAENAN